MKPEKEEINRFFKNNYSKMYCILFEDNGTIDMLNKDIKTLFSENKHFSDEAYAEVLKDIYLTDTRITSIMAGDRMKFAYKGVGLTDFYYVVKDITGMSSNKIRNIIISSDIFEFVYKKDIGNMKLVRPKMTKEEENEFKTSLLKKYRLINNISDDIYVEVGELSDL